MGLLDSLFGGSKTKRRSNLTKSQRRLLDDLVDRIETGLDEGIDPYTGQITPDATENQQRAWQFAELMEMGARKGDQYQADAARRLMSGEPAFDIDPEAREQQFEGEKAEAMRTFQEEIVPMISRGYAGKGLARSGAMTGSLGRAGAQLGDALNRRYNELTRADEAAMRGEQVAALDRMQQGVQAENMRRQGLMGAAGGIGMLGADQRAIQGQQLAEQFGQWQMAQDYNNPWLGMTNTALGTPAFSYMSETQPSRLGQGLQLAGLLGGGLGGVLG